MAFLPDGRLLVTEKAGRLLVVDESGNTSEPVSGVPAVDYGGQGGMGDVALHPDYARNGLVYLSYAEAGPANTRGAAVARGKLEIGERSSSLSDIEVVWRQYPKVLGRGHYGHRIVFDNAGFLWISYGDRQKFTPAQDMQSTIGKIVRLNDDGSIPADNPFVDYRSVDPLVDNEAVYGEIWSLGHRNPLGLAIDPEGRLWEIEMGPAHGDELNLIRRGANYGYPEVSNGDHYDGREIPDHDTRPEFDAPITDEASRRRDFYRGQQARSEAMQGFSGEYLEFLRSCNCDLAQGYLISRPMQPEKVSAILRSEIAGTRLLARGMP